MGAKCTYLANGGCKFSHVADEKSKPQKLLKVKAAKMDPGTVVRAVRSYAAKMAAVKRRLAVQQLDSKSSFLDVKTGKMASCDSDDVEALKVQLDLMKTAAKAGIGRSKVRATLYVETISASSANTAIASSFPLVVSASSEWTGFASLYDEVKVDTVDVHYIFGRNVDPSTYIGGSSVWVAHGYDSTYASTPGSVPDVLESSQHKLTVAASLLGTTVSSSKPEVFSIKIPTGPVANATPVTGGTGIVANFPGEWMACGDTADSVGYHRFYVSAGGPASVIGYRLVYAFHCEFRERT